MLTLSRVAGAVAITAALLLFRGGAMVPALAAQVSDDAGAAGASAPDTASLPEEIVGAANEDRAAAGLAPLSVDARLTAVAQQRATFLVDHSVFSHCSGGEVDPECHQSGLDVLPRLRQVGIQYDQPGTAIDENLALNNFVATAPESAAAQTNAAWLGSPEHKGNLLDGRVTATGVGIACCWVGTYLGNLIQPQDQAAVIVELFAGGPGLVPPASAAGPCTFVLGFATIAGLLPQAVGQCADNERHNAQNGDAVQHTSTGGLLVWRKSDNWTAFTDGYHTWVNGPYGLVERLNSQRFSWEANPDGLPVAR